MLLHELKSPGKKIYFFMVIKFCTAPLGWYTEKMLSDNASEIIANWFLTLQPDIFKIIFNLPNWAQEMDVI